MKWASAISERARIEEAIEEAAEAVCQDLGQRRPDLTAVFVSAHHAPDYPLVPSLVLSHLPGTRVVGCSAAGVIGAGHEVERRRAVAITAATLPGVDVRPFHLDALALPGPEDEPRRWWDATGVTPDGNPHFMVLVDPFTCDAEALVAGLDGAYPGACKIGGLASATGENALFRAGSLHRTGVVGVALSGNILVDPVVARGFRPLSKPMLVTRHRDNILLEVDGRPPMLALQDIHDGLSEADRLLFRNALHVGLEMHAEEVVYTDGELLVRNILGMDPESGAVAVGGALHQWQVVQFLLCDPKTAEQDLAATLERYRQEVATPVGGAMMFSCMGRGRQFFGEPDHDSNLFRERFGAVPLGGCFCGGEIGTLNGTTHLHGHASAFALFREPDLCTRTRVPPT